MLPYVAIHQYGLCLRQIRDADAEVVREGRNQPFVRRNHFYQEIISPEQHNNWYQEICKKQDYYLVACKGDTPLGLLYLKDITPGMRSGHIGVFFWDEKILRTRFPILALIAILDFFLITVGMQNIEAIIRTDNKSMVNIVNFLKFDVRLGAKENMLHINYTRDRILENHARLMEYTRRLSPASDTWNLRIEGDKDPRHHTEMLRVIP